MVKKLQKSTMRSSIRDYIYSQIVNGKLKPGDRIVEMKLARELEVSQAPVREAILELCVMGLLEERPYAGACVARMSPDDLEDAYNIRAFLEEYAAERAAKQITDEEIAAIDEVLSNMQSAVEANDVNAFTESDIQFHSMILNAAKSNELKRVWDASMMAQWTSFSMLTTAQSLSDIYREHIEIMRYIRQHNDHSAGAALFLHIRKYSSEVIEYMKRLANETSQTDKK